MDFSTEPQGFRQASRHLCLVRHFTWVRLRRQGLAQEQQQVRELEHWRLGHGCLQSRVSHRSYQYHLPCSK